jgi:hypothetical protein
VEDEAIRRWHRDNIGWNYVQIRSHETQASRFKTGVMAWHYGRLGALKNITTFCYDWNATNLYVVYPKGGDRFNREGKWYHTLGWEATREGIDDSRYLQTLVRALQDKKGLSERQAVAKVQEILAPIGVSYLGIGETLIHFGSYHALRNRIIDEILKLNSD